MSDEITGALEELSDLLRRLTEENEEKARLDDSNELADRMSRNCDEDSKFRQQRLLEEFERHNQLLEALIAKMGRSESPGKG